MAQHGLSEEEITTLATRSIQAKASAYCPYSKFPVGATLLTNDGQYISGANVENAAYPVGICAERTVLARAVADGHRNFKALAVATNITPPGSCT
ncbi:MAG: hypothetical protein M1826_002381 [Phylliscum demangeonii]|nr:MAG: hypothetical protein M1826_002381 [Phylliscum demangeonii]